MKKLVLLIAGLMIFAMSAQAGCGTCAAPKECASETVECAKSKAECAKSKAECGKDKAECAKSKAECGKDKAECEKGCKKPCCDKGKGSEKGKKWWKFGFGE